ncbi:DUF6302 family protein [Streptomyces sp. NPDC048109]|uniref:DUF6302 family protein n=1 Tax=unclassified Streptomyces TaxID=2593676 RepID=UPI0033D506FC
MSSSPDQNTRHHDSDRADSFSSGRYVAGGADGLAAFLESGELHDAPSFPALAGQFLGVRLLPTLAAYDYEHWRGRLVNPDLLLGSVAVALHRLPLLAIPTGADRRGGSMDMADPIFAEALVCALRGRPGFDRLTVFDHVVRWGEPVPEGLTPDAHCRFHGLRKKPRLGTCIRPPAGHGGRDLDTGRWPPAPGSPSGRQPTPPRAVVQAGAAPAP